MDDDGAEDASVGFAGVEQYPDPVVVEVAESEADPFDLKPTHFVIMNLQGYSFEYIDTAAAPLDPPVFAFAQGEGSILFRSSLSEYYRQYAGIKD